ncbi:MAG: DUF1800 domain-containing protein [Pseudomonadota bacterium]
MRRETISTIRFGYGLAPGQTSATLTDALIEQADSTSRLPPRIAFKTRADLILNYRKMRDDGEDARQQAQRKLRQQGMDDGRNHLSLAVTDPGFGARLSAFWSDHFTVAANGRLLSVLVPDFIETAIRPNITSRFVDMLRAAVTHPAMLVYLNQAQSIGPNSRVGQRRDKGLNENLAREVLELHTLGVDGPYTQADVRSFALLLTGLSVEKTGFKFRPGISEPGRHTVLGNIYGGARRSLGDIEDALNDIALHPGTAQHLARKLITHFVGPADEGFVTRIADAYLTSGGDLSHTYAAMLDDARAWQPDFHKAKLPFDFITSALRAAGAGAREVADIKPGDLRQGVFGAMQLMGQTFFRPPGPDGWSEAADAWITPPGLAARIRWATAFAERIEKMTDPRTFLDDALADAASPTLTFAVGGSESRAEGIALTLVSPEFNRR